MTRKSEPAMTVRDVAEFLNVDEKTIYRLTRHGKLPGFKVAGAWRFQRSVLEQWISSKTTARAAAKPEEEGVTHENENHGRSGCFSR